MFSNLGIQLADDTFKNLMYGFDGHTQSLTNTLGAVVDPINGLPIAFGDTQTIIDIKVTEQRAIGVQLWYKGYFGINAVLFALKFSSTTKVIYFETDINDIKLRNSYSGTSFVDFSNAIANLDPTKWTFIGMSIGWQGRSQAFMM